MSQSLTTKSGAVELEKKPEHALDFGKAWEYAPAYAPGSFEAELMAMLEPREWAGRGAVGGER